MEALFCNRVWPGIITLFVCTCMIKLSISQTIDIQRGSTGNGGTPIANDPFQLKCIVANFAVTGNHGISWSFNEQMIVWSQINGVYTGLDPTGDFSWRREYIDINGYLNFNLTIRSFMSRHNGYYKCLLAEGDVTNYIELAFDERYVGMDDV